MDADAELLLVLAARGQREEPAGLDDVLEDVLAGLDNERRTGIDLKTCGDVKMFWEVFLGDKTPRNLTEITSQQHKWVPAKV